MKREAGAGGAGSLAIRQEREGPYVPQWRSYHTRTFARRMWRCIYSANYATRARPKLLRHTHTTWRAVTRTYTSLLRWLGNWCDHTIGDLLHVYILFLFICVYLQAEAGGYSRRTNLASQAAGRHTHPGCAVDLKESGTPSRHPPSRFPSTKVPVQRSSKHTPTDGTFPLCVNLRGVRCTCLTPPHPAGALRREAKPDRFVGWTRPTHRTYRYGSTRTASPALSKMQLHSNCHISYRPSNPAGSILHCAAVSKYNEDHPVDHST